jgi:hypothetical protein
LGWRQVDARGSPSYNNDDLQRAEVGDVADLDVELLAELAAKRLLAGLSKRRYHRRAAAFAFHLIEACWPRC